MLCRINYDESELKEYSENSKFAGHKYCRLVFVAANMTRTQRRLTGERNCRFIQIDSPRLNSDGSIDTADEAAMLASFNKKEQSEMWIERISVPIPPTYMSMNGQVILDALGNQRVFTEISIPCIMKPGDKEPVDSLESIKARALRMREQRIKASEWASVEEAAHDAEPNVVDEINDVPGEAKPAAPAFGAARH